MATTVIARLTGTEKDDPTGQIYAIITVEEDPEIDLIDSATSQVSRNMILLSEDDPLDEMELRASLVSELKAAGLTLKSISYASMVRIGE